MSRSDDTGSMMPQRHDTRRPPPSRGAPRLGAAEGRSGGLPFEPFGRLRQAAQRKPQAAPGLLVAERGDGSTSAQCSRHDSPREAVRYAIGHNEALGESVRGSSGDGTSGPELGLSLSTVGEYAVIAVSGEIDMYTAPKLREAVRQLSAEGRMRVAIDLTPTEFCDSTGLGVLIGARRRLADAGGALVVVCSNPRIRKLLDLTGLDKVLDVQEAVPSE